ncbi:TetR/AcrR family transcriptional regulator [Sorangium sp. So ce1128]
MNAKRAPKRPSEKGATARGEPVVRGIFAATLAELSHVGYRALRVEDVAAKAGVNKTTIYRRWPAKQELVRAALQSLGEGKVVVQDTGALRTDMLALVRGFIDLFTSLAGQGLFQMLLVEAPDPELMSIVNSLRESQESPKLVIENAIARGEIALGVDPDLLHEIIAAFLINRIFVLHESIDDACVERLTDMLLHGVLHLGKRKNGK